MHCIVWVENLVFFTYLDKSILYAAVGVVIAAVVHPTCTSQWGGGLTVILNDSCIKNNVDDTTKKK